MGMYKWKKEKTKEKEPEGEKIGFFTPFELEG
jgi:hypothetical protein